MESTTRRIDAAFKKGKKEIDLRKKGIDDASFKYLLTKKEV